MALTVFGSWACSSHQGSGPAEVGAHLPLPARDITEAPPGPATAVFAGGCFWCTEAVFRQVKGVSAVLPGYAGGAADTANYEAVCTGTTGHAESIQITYDPHQVTYGHLLRIFFATHDPTQKDRQGPDTGTQYRSAVFYASLEQKEVAQAYIAQLTAAKVFPEPIVTTVEPLKAFYPAEPYHRDYADKHPNQPYIEMYALPKAEKVRHKFPDEVK